LKQLAHYGQVFAESRNKKCKKPKTKQGKIIPGHSYEAQEALKRNNKLKQLETKTS